MKDCPKWALMLFAAALGALTGIGIVEMRVGCAPPHRPLLRDLDEPYYVIRVPPPAPVWEHLARRIAAVKSTAKLEGTLEADRIAELIWMHCSDMDVYEVAALAWIESGFRADAVGPDGEDRGIFQLRRRWSKGIDALALGGAIPGACEKLRRWRTDCERWRVACAEGSRKAICGIHNPKPHHFMAHWSGGSAAVKTKGARRMLRRAAILRDEGGGS